MFLPVERVILVVIFLPGAVDIALIHAKAIDIDVLGYAFSVACPQAA